MTSPGKAPLPALAITDTTGQYAGGHPCDQICSQQRRVGDRRILVAEDDAGLVIVRRRKAIRAGR